MKWMPLRYEIIYYTSVALAVILILPNLYWAVRVPWKPKYPGEKRPPRGRTASKYLFRVAAISAFFAFILFNIYRF